MPTPANSLNISATGLQSFDGTKVFNGRTIVTPDTGLEITDGNGVAGNPSIQQGQGNSVILDSVSPTGATAVFNSWTTGYLYYYLEFLQVLPTTNATRLQIAFSTNGGVSYTTVTWDNGGFDAPSSGGGTFVSNAGASATPDLLLGFTQPNNSSEGLNGWLYMWGLDSGSHFKTLHQYITHPLTTTAMDFRNIGYHVRLTTQVTGLRLTYNGAGGFASGTINFYGVQP